MKPGDSNSNRRIRWRPRFGLAGMFVAMFIACILAAGGFYLLQAIRVGVRFGGLVIVMAMVAPLSLVILINLVRAILRLMNPRSGPGPD